MPVQSREVAVAMIGCGKLGIAIFQGLLRSCASMPNHGCETDLPAIHLRRLIATAQTDCSVNRIQASIEPLATALASPPCIDLWNQTCNAQAAQAADIVILGCKPQSLPALLTEDVVHALNKSGGGDNKHKIVISLLGGIDIQYLASSIVPEELKWSSCVQIVRALPNIAVSVRQSATVLAGSDALFPTDTDTMNLVSSLFRLLGHVQWLREEQMSTASALGASSSAFYAAAMRAMADGASSPSSASLLSPADALKLSALTAQGAATLVLGGMSPDLIIDQVATHGGATRVGLDLLQQRGAEKALCDAICETAQATRMLGQALKVEKAD